MQINSINKVLILSLLLAVSAGCANTTPQLDSKFGDAVNAAKAQQTLNPEASQNNAPVVGMNGEAADAAVDRYNDSFESPPVMGNVFTIGIGSGGGGSGGGGGSK